MDLRAMAVKGYSTFSKAPSLDPQYQIVLFHIPNTRLVELTPLQRCIQCILKLSYCQQYSHSILIDCKFFSASIQAYSCMYFIL